MTASSRCAVLLTLGAFNLTSVPYPPAPHRPAPFVQPRGQQLLRDGQPFRFVGVNCYQLAELDDGADRILARLAAHGVKVVRFWAFQKRCGPSGLDFSAFDRLVAAAKRHDVLLLPVLENHWEHCTYGDDVKPPEWYASGWRDAFAGAPLPYGEYIRAMAEHFRDEPQIFCWQLVNEPEIYPDTHENFLTLRAFARDAAREIKRVDPNHMISLGVLGVGQPATTGRRYRALHNGSALELVSAHDHGYIYEPLAGKQWKVRENSFYADLCDARSLAKPFVATESGVAVEWVSGNLVQRAELFRAKLDAFFDAGGAGYILWNYEPEPDTNFGFGPTDPVLPMLREVAARL